MTYEGSVTPSLIKITNMKRNSVLTACCLPSLLLSCAVALTACSDMLDFSQTDAGREIRLAGRIDQQNETRLNDNGFVTGDRMGVYIVDYENDTPGTLSNDNRASNLLYTFDGDDNSWAAPSMVYWKDNTTPVDVYGYYPGINYVATPTAYNFEVQADQGATPVEGEMSAYEQSDLLWGKETKVSPTTDVISVKMQHRLAGVRVHISKGTGISDTEWQKLDRIVSIENTVRTAIVDLSKGTATATGSYDRAIQMAPQSNDDYRAVVVPQTVAAGKCLVSITLDGIPYRHVLTSAMQYQAGKLHNFTITVNKNEQTGQYTLAFADDGISPWINDESSHRFSTQVYVVINCPEMGTLKQCIQQAGYDYKTMQNLKVTGCLTTEDFNLLRAEMPELKHLNLKDVVVRHALVGREFYDSNWHDFYADNSLPGDAFAHNKSIRSLVLPTSLKRIANQAFREMNLMYSTLEIPEGVTYIGVNAFSYNDYNGVEVVLPSTLDSIEHVAFNNCGYKCELKLTDNIRYIGPSAFAGTPNFYGTFHIPSKLRQVDGCFSEMGSNGSINGEIEIPQGITYVSGLNAAFSKRVALHFPKGVKEIGRGMPQALSELTFNDDLEAISGYECFAWHSIPFQIKLPPSLTSIAYRAFLACGLEGELVIPEGCLQIGAAAFAENNLTKVTLPSKLEMISGVCFGSNRQLTSITIPKYVSFIDDRAFGGCDALQTVICLAEEPPSMGYEPFEGVSFDKCVLQVPEKSVELYRHTDVWNHFKNITAYHELAFSIPEIVCLDKGTSRQGIIRAEGEWEVTQCPSWVTVSPSSGSGKAELTVTVNNGNGSTREGRIVFSLKNKNYTTYTDVKQVACTAKEDQTVTLQTASEGATAIPIFIVGEGYGAEDIASGKYLADMNQQMEHLFSTEPYKTYRNYFTVSTAYACSPESGMNGLQKFSSSDDKVLQYARAHAAAFTNDASLTVLVLCNTEAYNSHTSLHDSGLSISWLGKTTDQYPYDQRGNVLHHLGGRGFGKLGPEYVNHFTFMKACGCPGCNMTNEYQWARSKGWWKNVSTTQKMTELPWYHLIFDQRYAQIVDVFEGALNHARSTYRSESQSVMGAAHVYYYNTISRELIVRRIMQLAGKSFSYNDFFDNDKIELPEE